MPGFLDVSGYDGTERVDLGHDYWADVKRCLTSAEKGRVDDLLGGKQRVDVAGQRQYAELNYTASRHEMVCYSLVAWNIDDPDGTVWPLDGVADPRSGNVHYPPGCERRKSLARLPGPVFDRIWKVCDDLNSPMQGTEAATFPDPADGGDPDGDGGSAGPGAVPDGTGVLDPARLDAGDGAGPAAP